MSRRDDGGPAFPLDTNTEVQGITSEGMSLRDYYIAHAPAEPWPEFYPELPARPVLPNKFTMLNEADRRDWDNEILDDDETAGSDALRQFAAAYRAALKAQNEWEDSMRLQRRIQWPAYWADQMIKARNA